MILAFIGREKLSSSTQINSKLISRNMIYCIVGDLLYKCSEKTLTFQLDLEASGRPIIARDTSLKCRRSQRPDCLNLGFSHINWRKRRVNILNMMNRKLFFWVV